MVVVVREPAPAPLAIFIIAAFDGAVRGTGSIVVPLCIAPALLWPLWSYLAARRGWPHAPIAIQIVFHLVVLAFLLLSTDAARRDATLLTTLPLAMAITFAVYDVLLSLERSRQIASAR